MVGNNQKATGSSGPRLVMLPILRGWPDQKEKLVEHCPTANVLSFAHMFGWPKFSGSATLRKMGTLGFGHAQNQGRLLRMRSWPSEHMPRCFGHLVSRISVEGWIFHGGPEGPQRHHSLSGTHSAIVIVLFQPPRARD